MGRLWQTIELNKSFVAHGVCGQPVSETRACRLMVYPNAVLRRAEYLRVIRCLLRFAAGILNKHRLSVLTGEIRMKLTKILSAAAVASTAAAISTGVMAQDRSDWPESFTVGTASQGGTYFTYGSGWANLVSKELGVTGGGEVTGGPMQNMALVSTGDLAFGMSTMGPARESMEGNNPIAPGVELDKACAMFPMYTTPFSVTVLSSSGIKSIADIPAGAKIGFGPAGSTSDTYFPRMLETLGVDFERRNGGWSDLAGQLQDGLLDVIAFAAGVPVPAVSQLEVQTDINIIPFTKEEQVKIQDAFPVLPHTIPETAYTSLKAPARSVSMWNFAIANCDLPESFVYEAVKVVMSDHDRMMSIHKAARSTVNANWDKNTFMPWHPGAAKWFNENGATIGSGSIYTK